MASTTALPPPTCTARREAGQRSLRLLFGCEAGQLLAVVLLRGLYRPDRRQLLLQGLCRSDRPPAAFACSGPVLPALLACHLCHAMPTALIVLAPFNFALPPVHFHARRDHRKSNSLQAARTVPLAATTRVCSGGPCTVLHPSAVHCAICASTETAFVQPMRRCSLRLFKRGRPRTACEQPAKFPTPAS